MRLAIACAIAGYEQHTFAVPLQEAAVITPVGVSKHIRESSADTLLLDLAAFRRERS